MHTKLSTYIRKTILGFMLLGTIVTFSVGSETSIAQARDVETLQRTGQLAVRTMPPTDKMLIEEHVINGPSVPPRGFEAERQSAEGIASSAVTIDGVPKYTWTLGCSAGSGGIIAAYNDKLHPNIIEGEMPLDDSSMSTYTDACGGTYKFNHLVVSLDTFTDYWVEYDSQSPDPYTGAGTGCAVPAPRPNNEDDLSSQSGGWPQHAWGNTLGDFMYTSQSAFGNVDGATKFYTYENSASQFTCDEMSSNSKPDGSLGMKLFYETRGYAVGACYNQPTDNIIAGGFSLAQYKAEINAGRPVMLHLGDQPNDPGHTVVGVGYDTASNMIYIHDGWDYTTHTMTWGGSYSGMPLQMVSIVNIVPGTPNTYTISGNAGVANATIAYTGGYTTSDASGNYSFAVVSGWFGTVTPSKTGFTFAPANRFYANVQSNVVAQNYNDVNLLQDPSFETGTFTNDYWVGTSTYFGTPLCDVNCIGEVFARTGSIWAWFGGIENETATLSQTGTIPNALSASLDFYLWIRDARAGSDTADAFSVKVDGATVFSANATQLKYYLVYRPINVNISAYADGAEHEIEFSAITTGQVVSFHLDDVSLLIGTEAVGYTISGNTGVGNVTLNYTDGTSKTATSNGSGEYSLAVSSGWSGTVTPSKAGYIFSPANKTYTNVTADQINQNYAATAIPIVTSIKRVNPNPTSCSQCRSSRSPSLNP